MNTREPLENVTKLEASYNQIVQDQLGPYAVLAIGIPGSGKSTILSEFSRRNNFKYISSDEVRREFTGDPADLSMDAEVYALMDERAKIHLGEGNSVVLDETHTSANRRINVARICHQAGATAVIGVLFDVSLEEALRRNQARDRVVPDQVVEMMHQNLSDFPPSTAQGLDQIIRI